MSTDHKRPLFAFVVVVVMCALIIANALRSQAALGVLHDPEVRIVAGSELVTMPVPAASIHPLNAQVRHPSPPQTKQETSTRTVRCPAARRVSQAASSHSRPTSCRPSQRRIPSDQPPGPAKPSSTCMRCGAAPYTWKPSSTTNQPCFTSTAMSTGKIKNRSYKSYRTYLHVQRFTNRRIPSHPPDLRIQVVMNKRVTPQE